MDAAELRAHAAHYFQKASELASTLEGDRARAIAQDYLQRARDREEADRYLLRPN